MAASDLQPCAGKFGAVIFSNALAVSYTGNPAGTALPFEEWSITGPQGDYLDCANFTSNGDFGVVGIVGGEVTLKAKFNKKAGGNPFQTALTFRPDTTYTFFLGYTTTVGFTLSILLTGVPVNQNVRQIGLVEFHGRIQGRISYPGDTGVLIGGQDLPS